MNHQTHNILQWNCNGVTTHLSELKLLTNTFRPYCISLQETHLKPHDVFSFRGYKVFRKDDNTSSYAKGGTAILLHQSFLAEEIKLQSVLQAVAIKILAPLKLTICSIYLPPSANVSLNDFLRLISELPTPLILTGDFNAWNRMWGSNSTNERGKLIEEALDIHNLAILNSGAHTHLSFAHRTFSAIDLSVCSPTLLHRLQWNPTEHLYGSDHFPILISDNTPRINYTNPTKWCLQKANWYGFQTDFSLPQLSGNVEADVEQISSAILEAAKHNIPACKPRAKHTVPWWNDSVKKAIKEKKAAFNRFKKYPTEENFITFKKLRATARRQILQSKRECWHQYVNTITNSTPSAEVWRKIRNINGKPYCNHIPAIKMNDNIITECNEITEIMADYFENISSNSNLPEICQQAKSDLEKPLDFNTAECKNYNSPFSLSEMEHAIQSSHKSSPGPDNIPYEMIKRLPETGKHALLDIYNLIWETGLYPQQWCESTIIPILKTGKDQTERSNYRPISLTCCLSKVLEKMVNYRLVWTLEHLKLLSKYQCGFRKYHSTSDCLTHLENTIITSFENKLHTTAILLDLERAYDTTWRYGILQTLHKWNIRGNLPLFIKGFLNKRQFKVRINGSMSSIRTQQNGIPQGSTLSVTLFVIAVNDILKQIDEPIGKCMYVDDLLIFSSGSNIDIINRQLQSTIDKLLTFIEGRGFKFSTTKSKCIHFCRKRPHDLGGLKIGERLIEIVDVVKYLGIYFDSKLNFHYHIETLANKCKQKLNLIKCLSSLNWGANRETLLKIYTSLILSRIDYGSIAYSSTSKSNLRKLNVIHNMGIRHAIGAFRTSPVQSLYCESGIEPLKLRREKILLKYVTEVQAKRSHLNHNIFSEYSNILENAHSKSSASRALVMIKQWNINTRNVTPINIYQTPPWIIKELNFHTELAELDRENTNSLTFNTLFQEIVNRYKDKVCIYTDGSKTSSGVGYAFCINGETHSWSKPAISTIYTAELHAIWRSLQYFYSTASQCVAVICTDSLSSIATIKDRFSTNSVIHNINTLIHNIRELGKDVVFVWTPAHIGIHGNEMADNAAKLAVLKEEIDSELSIDDIKTQITQYSKDNWQNMWHQSNLQLQEIKPSVEKWYHPEQLERRESVVLTRIRIGHCRFSKKYLFCKENPPICETCHCPMTMKHVLTECTLFIPQRSKFKIPNTFKEALSDPDVIVNSTIPFLKDTKFFNKI